MELFFDRFGGYITILIGILLILSSVLLVVSDSRLSDRIATLEGCCDEVQQYMESGGGKDESAMKAYVDEQLKKERQLLDESISQKITENAESLKSEIESSVTKEVTEKVKETVSKEVTEKVDEKAKELSESQKESKESASSQKKRRTQKSSSETKEVTQQTLITESAHQMQSTEAPDPDEEHFRIGDGEEED